MTDPANFHGSRFGKASPPEGFGLHLELQADQSVRAKLSFASEKEGPPNHVHGGALATVLDEAMGAVVVYAGRLSLTLTLNYTFLAPTPLHTEITVSAFVEKIEGNRTFTRSQIILPDGTVSVEGTGIFVHRPDLFEKFLRQNSDL